MDQQTPMPGTTPAENVPALDTRELVKRHLQDPNHVITDEELSQVVISTSHLDISEHPLIKALDEDRDEAQPK